MRPFYEDQKRQFQCHIAEELTFPAHLHSEVEVLFVMEGSMEVTVQNQTKILGKNETALIFPNMIHSYESTGFCRAVLCIFAPGYTKEYYQLFRSRQPRCPFSSLGIHNPDIPLAFGRMLHYAERAGSVSAAWMNLILACLVQEMDFIPRADRDDGDVSDRLISYISLHFQEPLTLDVLAKELHFNKYYISRAFAARLHCGFYEYVNRLRADYAARLLCSTDLHITAIWQEAGFESQKTFNRAFQACYQMTPSQYRKMLLDVAR